MARYPLAAWLPLGRSSRAITPTQVILHTAVDGPGRTSLRGWFSRSDLAAHFMVQNDGRVEQYVDTARLAAANRTANSRAISIETEDDGDPMRPWTKAQQDAIVALLVWCHRTHGVPLHRCARHDAPGIGWHAMWGAPSPWTPARGKTCPGPVRIAQIPGLIARAAAEVAPKPTPTPPKPPTPSPGTLAALRAATNDAKRHVLRRGVKGPHVRVLQMLLQRAGQSINIDGAFGPATERAVKAVQARHGLKVDGVVGPWTWTVLDR